MNNKYKYQMQNNYNQYDIDTLQKLIYVNLKKLKQS